MSNELAHKYLSEAVRDYDQLDQNHCGHLNLVDLARYEKLGTEQKAVGTFLEKNIQSLSGISAADLTSYPDQISKSDLEFGSIFTGTDKKAMDDKARSDSTIVSVAGAVEAASIAILPALPAIGFGGFAGPLGAAAAGAVVIGAGAIAGYESASWESQRESKERAKKLLSSLQM